MPSAIFRSYDIRGIYGNDIDEQVFDRVGNALAQFTERDILIARDARLSSEKLLNALMNGALKAEKTVQNIGEVPLSVAVDWAISQQLTLAYITASHLGKEWNGVKFFYYTGVGFSEADYQKIGEMVEEGKYFSRLRAVPVREETEDTIDLYIKHLEQKIPKIEAKKRVKILVDCGNGTAGIIAKRLFSKFGFEADTLFEKPDGTFPNRASDPKEDPLTEMKKKVGKYDFGLAYDGDADRFVAVTKSGIKLTPEQAAFVILSELAKEKKGGIVANAECSMLVEEMAKKFDVPVIRCRVGHNFLMEAMQSSDAIFGMEFSGHYAIKHISSFDDAIAVSLYFAQAVQKAQKPLEDILKELPEHFSERLDFPVADEKKFEVVEKIKSELSRNYSVETLDGARINMDSSWALIRASNTSPLIRMTVEAKSKERLEETKNIFSEIVKKHL